MSPSLRPQVQVRPSSPPGGDLGSDYVYFHLSPVRVSLGQRLGTLASSLQLARLSNVTCRAGSREIKYCALAEVALVGGAGIATAGNFWQ